MPERHILKKLNEDQTSLKNDDYMSDDKTIENEVEETEETTEEKTSVSEEEKSIEELREENKTLQAQKEHWRKKAQEANRSEALDSKEDSPKEETEESDEIPAWRIREKEEEKKTNKELALKQFVQSHSDLQAENDVDDVNYKRFTEHVNKYGLKSSSVEGIKQELEGFYRMANLQPKEDLSSEDAVEDSGVGDTTTQLKGKDKEKILTRKLTEKEKAIVKMRAEDKGITYEESEKWFRKKLAEKE